MKYFSYLLLLQTVFWAGCEKSDGENGPAARAFPDPAFRQCVLEYFDFDGDGMVSDDEAAHATVIFCQEAGIVSLKGIERFPNLRVLNCIRNHISSLDLSANRALETLWCHDNPLVELDVSGCEGLTELDCRGWGLRRLDASGCSSLEALDCGDNALTSLDLEG